MSPSSPLPVALVGAGGIGRAYADVFAASNVARCVAVADIDAAAADALAERVGCTSLPDLDAVADVTDLGAVVVCTPPSTHPDLVVSLLAQGIPVLCEKPLAIGPAEARRMTDAAAASGVALAVATKFRFVAEMSRLLQMVESGDLGELTLVENAFTASVDMTQRWNTRPEVSGGGVIADNAPHSFDLVRAVAGPIDEVLAVEGRRTQTPIVEDTVTCHTRSRSGVPATIDLSWTIDKKLDDYLKVWGTKGAVRLGWRRSLAQTNGGEWAEIGPGYQKVPAMQGAFDAFVQWVRGVAPPALEADDLLATVDVTAAAYESLASGRWAKVDHSRS